ncbi:MAG: nucleotidyltransferase domain-containing protein [Vicinamibacteraceae bacterium]
MDAAPATAIADLPTPIGRVLDDFVRDARSELGDTLQSIVLFGSAAENRIRATSDVNVAVVLSAFEGGRVERLRPALERAHAAIRLEILWLLAAEVGPAAEAFAVKFTDILRRHRVLHGPDPFASLVVSRQATIARLRQVLLNQILRLRASYAIDGGREERLALRVADAAGPLRVGAAEILELEGGPALPPRDALARLTEDWAAADRTTVLDAMSAARETRQLEPGQAGAIMLGVVELASFLHRRAARLS